MSCTALKRLCMIASAAMTIGWAGITHAVEPETESFVVARLYGDFAWQAIADQPNLMGPDLAHQGKVTLGKYFAPALLGLLIKDAACQVRYLGICNLDFDLLFDSQDPRATDLHVMRVSPGKVRVVFKDPVDGRKTRIDFDIVKVAGVWKIADIIYSRPEKVSLKEILSRKVP
jgi:hypothetical protein